VGWVIQAFSLNLLVSSEFFIRLAAVVAGTANTWLLYCIGKHLRDEATGWYAALLYTASVYGFIIAGVFMLPDAPQSVFWLMAILLLLKAFQGEVDTTAKRRFILASVCIGLAMLSKYTSAFLWLGMVSYIVLYNRKWLKTSTFYIGHLVMALLFLPVIIWNIQNHFVSFLFHSGRVVSGISDFTLNYFITEILGEALYTNPVVLVFIVLAVAAFFTGKFSMEKPEIKLLVWSTLPVIVVFLVASLFRRTLPHWNGLGYITLLPLVALGLSKRTQQVFPGVMKGSLAFMAFLLVFSTLQISTGFIPIHKIISSNKEKVSADYSLEVYGWRQLRSEFIPLANKYEALGSMQANSPIVSYRWFPAANYSYYAARGTTRFVMAAGDTSAIHKYAWINSAHGGFSLNTDAWYITSSRDYKNPATINGLYYEKILAPDTINIIRKGETAYCFYVYRLKNLQSKR